MITKAIEALRRIRDDASIAKCSIPRLKQLPVPSGHPFLSHHSYLFGLLIILNNRNKNNDTKQITM